MVVIMTFIYFSMLYLYCRSLVLNVAKQLISSSKSPDGCDVVSFSLCQERLEYDRQRAAIEIDWHSTTLAAAHGDFILQHVFFWSLVFHTYPEPWVKTTNRLKIEMEIS